MAQQQKVRANEPSDEGGDVQRMTVPMNCMLQEKRRAETPAGQLLRDEELAADDVLAFNNSGLQHLLDKGLRTPEMLARVTMAGLKKPPPIPHVLAQAILEKFNPDALTAAVSMCEAGWQCYLL